MLETLREYGTERLADTRTTSAPSADLRRRAHFAALMARYDPQLRGPGQLAAMRVISAEYDNALAALRRRCDTGDAPGAVALALDLTWYWQMFGRHPDAAYWLGEALAVPGGEPTPERDCAHAIYLLNRVDTRPAMTAEEAADDRARAARAGRPAARVSGAAGPVRRARRAPARLPAGGRGRPRSRSSSVWPTATTCGCPGWPACSGPSSPRTRASSTRYATDVEAALACFRQVGDRWGQATALPMRAQLRQYDGDLDGALADLREARSLAGEFGSLNLSRRGLQRPALDRPAPAARRHRPGDRDDRLGPGAGAAPRARRRCWLLVDAWEAGLRVRLGDLDRARDTARRQPNGICTATSRSPATTRGR